jgi:uncharacterized small protein (DUF1192 family)
MRRLDRVSSKVYYQFDREVKLDFIKSCKVCTSRKGEPSRRKRKLDALLAKGLKMGGIYAQIAALQAEITDLRNKITRLENAKSKAQSLIQSAGAYKWDVKRHAESVNQVFGSFSWEGQSVKEFKRLYFASIDTFDAPVLHEYHRLIGDMDVRIAQYKNEIASKEQQIAALYAILAAMAAAAM